MIQKNRTQKRAILSKKLLIFICFWQFFTAFPFFIPKSKSLSLLFTQLLFFKERQEWFTLFKRVTVSESLLLLCTKERQEWFAFFQEGITLWLTKKEWFAGKTEEQIPNPDFFLFLMWEIKLDYWIYIYICIMENFSAS